MLQNLISITADKRGITLKQIALAAGASQPAISNFLRGKTEISFYTALKIVRYLFPDQEKEIMTTYIKEIRKPENIRLAMEYASIQNMLDLLHWLVVTQQNSHNALNREWAKVYADYLQEVAHQKIKKGDLHGAKAILTQIDCNSLTVQGRAFQLYYLGICMGSTTLLYNSLTLFIRIGNKLFARLPYLELLRAGEKAEAVTAAYGKLTKMDICNLVI